MARRNAFQVFVHSHGGVKELRYKLGARGHGYSEAAVYRWYNGERVPRWSVLFVLAGMSGLPVEKIVELTGANRKYRRS